MTNDDIKKIREMMEFLVKQKIVDQIKKLSPDEKKIYEMAESKNQSEIIKSTGFSSGKVSIYLQKLEKEGILIKDGQKYRKII